MSEATSPAVTRLVLVGATGRMGTQILRLLPDLPAVRLVGALASERSSALDADAGSHAGSTPNGVPISAVLTPLLAQADLVIDFSTGAAVAATLAACVSARVPLLIGTTALPRELDAALERAAQTIAVLVAPNTSLAVNLLLELVGRAAQALPQSYDVEVLDVHHRHKLDAPSGTALALASAAAQGRGQTLEQSACYARHGRVGERPSGQIGFAVVRGGDVVGEHQVVFLGPGETLSLTHRATDRAVFARGALMAGQWLCRQPPGRYAMRDVFLNKISELALA